MERIAEFWFARNVFSGNNAVKITQQFPCFSLSTSKALVCFAAYCRPARTSAWLIAFNCSTAASASSRFHRCPTEIELS